MRLNAERKVIAGNFFFKQSKHVANNFRNRNAELVRIFNDGEAFVSGIEIDNDLTNHESMVEKFIADDMSNADDGEDEHFLNDTPKADRTVKFPMTSRANNASDVVDDNEDD